MSGFRQGSEVRSWGLGKGMEIVRGERGGCVVWGCLGPWDYVSGGLSWAILLWGLQCMGVQARGRDGRDVKGGRKGFCLHAE